ncbi:MAG: hypothetical protein Q8W45_01760 [Candidatus Palauibacterales bacterium]|nr:hypothetical protein [Candidatus Palauibacterales bacterium]MDP2481981.1 hypothetical protein [Candidatus Palauibacterales bacterium]
MIARQIVLAFGWLVAGFGGWVIVQPDGLVDLAEVFLRPERLWLVVAIRLAVGVFMWIAAPVSRMPRTLRALGALIFVSGVAIPIVGLGSIQAIAEWGAGLRPIALRIAGLITVGFGGFIVWSLWPRRREA